MIKNILTALFISCALSFSAMAGECPVGKGYDELKAQLDSSAMKEQYPTGKYLVIEGKPFDLLMANLVHKFGEAPFKVSVIVATTVADNPTARLSFFNEDKCFVGAITIPLEVLAKFMTEAPDDNNVI